MGRYKGSAILSLRKIFQKEGKPVEEKFLAQLSSEDRDLYHKTVAIAWIPDEAAARILEAAAGTLFPGDPHGVRQVGRAQALTDLNGLYRVFVRVFDIYFMITQAERLWSLYHDTGHPRSEYVKGVKSGRLIVEQYPNLLPAIRESISGYIIGTAELVGGKNLRVATSDELPATRIWSTTWD